MSLEFESQSIIDSHTRYDELITYAHHVYVFENIPMPGNSVSLEQIAEDIEETPELVLAVMDELREDKRIDFIHDEGTLVITYRHEEFLKSYSVYQANKL